MHLYAKRRLLFKCQINIILLPFFIIFQNGLISAIPFIINFVAIVLAGVLADHLRHRNLLSTEAVRKLANTTGKRSTTFMIFFRAVCRILIMKEYWLLINRVWGQHGKIFAWGFRTDRATKERGLCGKNRGHILSRTDWTNEVNKEFIIWLLIPSFITFN